MVDSIKRYKIHSNTDDNGSTTYVYYSLFDVRVNIAGHWVQGFACGCSHATALTAETVLDGAYSYQYSICKNDKVCGNMLLMPAWFCNECNKCTQFLSQEEKDCKYFLKTPHNQIDSVKEIPVGYKLDYPTEHSTFIQVIFMDDPFYFKSDYIALQIICFWIMIILPAAYILLHLIYLGFSHIKDNY
ncbi:unnamed protein product [Blepharisma stoltei]|uniref:Uncharacterized protein n=1 Tax=Blepharisma stoltei TaxID=1481888 RepID=A0AAU9J595_9CILI|nr:unnamed protein product [Blepharisma stoltei]